MEPIAVPAEAKYDRPHARLVQMGPPPGVSDDDCGTAEMLIEPDHFTHAGGIPRGNYAYYRPTETEIEMLRNGGFLELAQYGHVVQPFGLRVGAVRESDER
jgi:hypothetical protein